MPNEVVEITTSESSEAEATPEVVAAEATPAVDEATWKRRIAGKDQALTATQRERDAIRAERDALSKWKAEQETANMTELQKALAERDSLAKEAADAKAEATAIRLGAKYPLAAALLGDDLSKFDEARVAEINGTLVKEQAAESEEPDARIDPNSPRRSVPRPPANDLAAAKAALVAAGNPFYDENQWGSTNRR
jgi:hypothetical protein